MTNSEDDHWVGDIGHLVLADATLGALLIDILDVLEYASYPRPPGKINQRMTTGKAARRIEERVKGEHDLSPSQLSPWLAEVKQTTGLRNGIVHAVARERCANCGRTERFVHSCSQDTVDRTDEAVRALTTHILSLRQEGMAVADLVAQRVNERIVARAREDAEATGEIQTPPQVYPRHVTHVCADCSDNGRGTITLRVGTAVEVHPSKKQER